MKDSKRRILITGIIISILIIIASITTSIIVIVNINLKNYLVFHYYPCSVLADSLL